MEFTQKYKNLPFNILVIALLVGFFCVFVVTRTLSGDGLVYSSIAMNMAHGIGSIWAPVFTKHSFYGDPFYQHPPFQFYLQSFYFKLFGDGFYTEKLYCLTIFAVTSIYIVKLWHLLNNHNYSYSYAWFPVLIWSLAPITLNVYKTNVCDSTLATFTTISVYYLLLSLKYNHLKKYGYIFIAATFISLAFFTNGLQALFPLAMFFLFFVIYRELTFKLMILNSVALIGTVLVIFGLVFLLPGAFHATKMYFIIQVFTSLSGSDPGHYPGMMRVYALWILLNNCMPIFVLWMLILASKFCFTQHAITNELRSVFKNKSAGFLFLVAFSASLPVMVTSRLGNSYFIQAFPFFTLAFTQLMMPSIVQFVDAIRASRFWYWMMLLFSGGLLIVAFVVLAFSAGKIGADYALYRDVDVLKNTIPENSLIYFDKNLNQKNKYFATIYRLTRIITIDYTKPSVDNKYEYLLLSKNNRHYNRKAYKIDPVNLEEFNLYKRIA